MMISVHTPKKEILNIVENCSQCTNACHLGTEALVEDEIKKIAEYLEISEQELKQNFLEQVERFSTTRLRPKTKHNKIPGECIFLQNNECIIEEVKPFGCKINKQCKLHAQDLAAWFNIRYFLNLENPFSVRDYIIYVEKGGHVIEGAKPHELVDPKKLDKIKNMQAATMKNSLQGGK